MHKISLVTAGKIKTPSTLDGCNEYLERLRHFAEIRHVIVPSGDWEKESTRIGKHLDKAEGFITVLDEHGKQFSSKEFASWLARKRDDGMPLTFAIGGAYGFTDTVIGKAGLILSLSKMTLPHELAQLFFLEQLYRAYAILHGSGYHH